MMAAKRHRRGALSALFLASCMASILVRIKRAVIAGNVVFTSKATLERERDSLTEGEVVESIITAQSLYKSVRSANPATGRREYLHIIHSRNLSGRRIYTKGKLVAEGEVETYYVLVSAKDSE